MSVSGRSVHSAKTVLDRGHPELIKAVDGGQMAVSAAAEVAKAPVEQQLAVVTEAKQRQTGGGAKKRKKKAERGGTRQKVEPDQLKRLQECTNELSQILDKAKEVVTVEELRPKIKELREIIDSLMK